MIGLVFTLSLACLAVAAETPTNRASALSQVEWYKAYWKLKSERDEAIQSGNDIRIQRCSKALQEFFVTTMTPGRRLENWLGYCEAVGSGEESKRDAQGRAISIYYVNLSVDDHIRGAAGPEPVDKLIPIKAYSIGGGAKPGGVPAATYERLERGHVVRVSGRVTWTPEEPETFADRMFRDYGLSAKFMEKLFDNGRKTEGRIGVLAEKLEPIDLAQERAAYHSKIDTLEGQLREICQVQCQTCDYVYPLAMPVMVTMSAEERQRRATASKVFRFAAPGHAFVDAALGLCHCRDVLYPLLLDETALASRLAGLEKQIGGFDEPIRRQHAAFVEGKGWVQPPATTPAAQSDAQQPAHTAPERATTADIEGVVRAFVAAGKEQGIKISIFFNGYTTKDNVAELHKVAAASNSEKIQLYSVGTDKQSWARALRKLATEGVADPQWQRGPFTVAGDAKYFAEKLGAVVILSGFLNQETELFFPGSDTKEDDAGPGLLRFVNHYFVTQDVYVLGGILPWKVGEKSWTYRLKLWAGQAFRSDPVKGYGRVSGKSVIWYSPLPGADFKAFLGTVRREADYPGPGDLRSDVAAIVDKGWDDRVAGRNQEQRTAEEAAKRAEEQAKWFQAILVESHRGISARLKEAVVLGKDFSQRPAAAEVSPIITIDGKPTARIPEEFRTILQGDKSRSHDQLTDLLASGRQLTQGGHRDQGYLALCIHTLEMAGKEVRELHRRIDEAEAVCTKKP